MSALLLGAEFPDAVESLGFLRGPLHRVPLKIPGVLDANALVPDRGGLLLGLDLEFVDGRDLAPAAAFRTRLLALWTGAVLALRCLRHLYFTSSRCLVCLSNICPSATHDRRVASPFWRSKLSRYSRRITFAASASSQPASTRSRMVSPTLNSTAYFSVRPSISTRRGASGGRPLSTIACRYGSEFGSTTSGRTPRSASRSPSCPSLTSSDASSAGPLNRCPGSRVGVPGWTTYDGWSRNRWRAGSGTRTARWPCRGVASTTTSSGRRSYTGGSTGSAVTFFFVVALIVTVPPGPRAAGSSRRGAGHRR